MQKSTDTKNTQQNTNYSPFEILYELLIRTKRKGYIEINGGVYLNSRDSIIADQECFMDEDLCKEFNFNDYNFWITTDSNTEPIGINTEDDLSEFLNEHEINPIEALVYRLHPIKVSFENGITKMSIDYQDHIYLSWANNILITLGPCEGYYAVKNFKFYLFEKPNGEGRLIATLHPSIR